MSEERYSIGEVLNQLKDDFSDITISKIRFLEGEGLVSPARTDAGYRMFSDDDVDRLRFVLTAQRDHYLPLKVIREQLERLDRGEIPSAGPETGRASDEHVGGDARPAQLGSMLDSVMGADGPDLTGAAAGEPMSLPELCDATGLEANEVRELRDYGVLGERGDDAGVFDPEDVVAATVASRMLQLGLEPRHLRMYRQQCDREVGLFEQLAAPLLRQRNAEARRQATGQLEQLAGLSTQLQRALMSRALRAYLHGS